MGIGEDLLCPPCGGSKQGTRLRAIGHLGSGFVMAGAGYQGCRCGFPILGLYLDVLHGELI